MATDWKKIAAAMDPPIPAQDVEKMAPVLDALEAAFGPLRASIPAGTDLWTGPVPGPVPGPGDGQ